MFNEEQVLKQLREGISMDEILSKASDIFNKANATFEAEQAEKNAAENQKVEDFQDILDLIQDFLVKYYPDFAGDVDDAFEEISAKEIIELFDSGFKMITDLEKLIGKPAVKAAPKGLVAGTIDDKDADFVIKSFLKSIGV